MEDKPAETSEPPAPLLKTQPAVLTATISITRKATGKVETYTLTATPTDVDDDETRR